MNLPTYPWTPIDSDGNARAAVPSHHIAIKKAKDEAELNSFFDKATDFRKQSAGFYDKEAGNLYRVREFCSPHLIKSIAAYQIDQTRCLIFPWADGGNLSDLWQKHEDNAKDRSKVRWQLLQFVGICSALDELHQSNVRHGDLKPENILWFEPNKDGGILQIADIGLATFHEKEAHTKNRKGMATETPSGTSRYEPPEMDQNRGRPDPRSRQYDMWSMGCIVFEFLLWLVYGHGAIRTFRNQTPYFWQKHYREGRSTYEIHDFVTAVMKDLSTKLETDSAYMHLFDLVRKYLLIIPISDKYESVKGCREIACEAHKRIKHIYDRTETDTYYLEPMRLDVALSELRHKHEVHQKDGNLAVAGHSETSGTAEKLPTPPNESVEPEEEVAGISKLNDDWISLPDNDFAADFFSLIGWDKARPTPSTADMRLCHACAGRSAEHLFDDVYDLTVLQQRARKCRICSILQIALTRKGLGERQSVQLQQDTGHVGLRNGPNLLSLYCEPDPTTPNVDGAPLGLPVLFERASPEFFQLLKEWTRVCDSEHDTCRRNEDHKPTIPTRLIEVGACLRLVDAADVKSPRYVALSHCWGPLKENEKFCTYKNNIQLLKKHIDLDTLPRTFRDAVTVARGLGIDYVWIDSLCIIQDDDDDWQNESRKMEQIFNVAYCTIGASSAKSSLDGFLTNPLPRDVVALPFGTGNAAYACIDIDDFHGDVELGPLNSRGWVLQERALSRRTIFFTSTQVYWECGADIHCETLAHLENTKVALLGDANFPNAAVGHYKDGRQLLIQDLYERYSGLAFTKSADRAVAVLGLQERLARTFNTKAAFGLFEAYFARGLLWKRRDFQLMNTIPQPRGRRIPSWSSLSKEGRIKYMDATTELKFKEVEWATNDFDNPFKTPSGTVGGIETATFRGLARAINMSRAEILRIVRFDCKEEYSVEELRCVVIGRNKVEEGQLGERSYILVIHRERNALGENVYVRVGVGSIKSDAVGTEGAWVAVH
ncbi:HET-domain-containing protein [Ophiobolus disseminans]|uniref:HET-domain-containing protein n=1 Tax=Ophiobolus disseminans TaxID=1469910 RepID=A0A6A6ZKW8_9PLEO|nr:HET-domain-containing protein [Ophiobolus disseminans]